MTTPSHSGSERCDTCGGTVDSPQIVSSGIPHMRDGHICFDRFHKVGFYTPMDIAPGEFGTGSIPPSPQGRECETCGDNGYVRTPGIGTASFTQGCPDCKGYMLVGDAGGIGNTSQPHGSGLSPTGEDIVVIKCLQGVWPSERVAERFNTSASYIRQIWSGNKWSM
jgi:hypothetical protein